MEVTQISSEDDLLELPSPKTHVFSKKTLHDDEQPVKPQRIKCFFIDTASEQEEKCRNKLGGKSRYILLRPVLQNEEGIFPL
jgi:hypothetical protein